MDNQTKETGEVKKVTLEMVMNAREETEKAGKFMMHVQAGANGMMPASALEKAIPDTITKYNEALENERALTDAYISQSTNGLVKMGRSIAVGKGLMGGKETNRENA